MHVVRHRVSIPAGQRDGIVERFGGPDGEFVWRDHVDGVGFGVVVAPDRFGAPGADAHKRKPGAANPTPNGHQMTLDRGGA
ncbi:MAG: hypothetical protein U9Q74_10365, partial [Gemmatimonadota bacterium]|nr:hypothetical protein [Gemmatimonadota bacterium]